MTYDKRINEATLIELKSEAIRQTNRTYNTLHLNTGFVLVPARVLEELISTYQERNQSSRYAEIL